MIEGMNIKLAIQNEADNKNAIRALKKEGRALNAIAAANRTSGQVARFTAVFAELDALEDKAEAIDADLVTARRLQEEERGEGARLTTTASVGLVKPARGRRYAEMFGAAAISADGWKHVDEFLAVLHQGRADQRLAFLSGQETLQATATATKSVPSDGGFSVPTQYVSEWMDASLETELIRPRANVFPMTGGELHVPGFDANSNVSTLFGGFAGGWVAEATEITPETAKIRLIALYARKLGILSEVSNELLSDGIGYGEQLGRAIIAAISWYMDYAFFNGTGAAQPLGIFNSPALITVPKESGQSAAPINYPNLAAMFARMPPACVKNSVWVANQNTIPQLLQLGVPVGTGGDHVPVLSESDGKFRMLTREVLFTEKVPSLGTVGDIGLYDFTQYAIGLRQNMTLDKSMHPGFTRDTSHYRGILRADGQPTWNAARTPKVGSTVSPFVVLATRA